jgi:hypothetical protein
MAARTTGCALATICLAIIQADDRRGIGHDDGISALLGRHLKPAFRGVCRHRAGEQFFRYRPGGDGFGPLLPSMGSGRSSDRVRDSG